MAGDLDSYYGVLFRIASDGQYLRLAECPHRHRQRSKAIECAEKLAERDGAPQP